MKTSDRLAPLKALVLTFLCQLVGAMFASGVAQMGIPVVLIIMIHSFISGYLSIFLRLSTPWRFVNFMIPAGIMISMAFPGYGWVWLVFLIIFGLIFLPTFWTRVPYYPSSQKVYSIIASELPNDRAFNFLDIGCGDAKLLAYLGEKFPLAKFEGLDLSPTAILAAKLNTKNNKNVDISLGDYWKKSFSDYDFIYAFLSPTPMAEVEEKIRKELRKGSKLLVNSFKLPNLQPLKQLSIEDNNQTDLYLYELEK